MIVFSVVVYVWVATMVCRNWKKACGPLLKQTPRDLEPKQGPSWKLSGGHDGFFLYPVLFEPSLENSRTPPSSFHRA